MEKTNGHLGLRTSGKLDDLIGREDEADMQHSRPKRSRRMAATAGDFLFY